MGNETSQSSSYERVDKGKLDLPPMLDRLDTNKLNFTLGQLDDMIEQYLAAKAGKSANDTMKAVIGYRDRLHRLDFKRHHPVNVIDVLAVIDPGFSSPTQAATLIFRFRRRYDKAERKNHTRGPMGPKTRAALKPLMDLTKGVSLATAVTYGKHVSRVVSLESLAYARVTFFSASDMGEAGGASRVAASAPASAPAHTIGSPAITG